MDSNVYSTLIGFIISFIFVVDSKHKVPVLSSDSDLCFFLTFFCKLITRNKKSLLYIPTAPAFLFLFLLETKSLCYIFGFLLTVGLYQGHRFFFVGLVYRTKRSLVLSKSKVIDILIENESSNPIGNLAWDISVSAKYICKLIYRSFPNTDTDSVIPIYSKPIHPFIIGLLAKFYVRQALKT